MLQADARWVMGDAVVQTCDDSLVLVDQVPQLLISLHVKGALVIPNPLHPGEPETVTRRKVLADDRAYICLHLHMWCHLMLELLNCMQMCCLKAVWSSYAWCRMSCRQEGPQLGAATTPALKQDDVPSDWLDFKLNVDIATEPALWS